MFLESHFYFLQVSSDIDFLRRLVVFQDQQSGFPSKIRSEYFTCSSNSNRAESVSQFIRQRPAKSQSIVIIIN